MSFNTSELAELIRGILYRYFPGVKFSVESDYRNRRIRINWVDGVAEKQVMTIAQKLRRAGGLLFFRDGSVECLSQRLDVASSQDGDLADRLDRLRASGDLLKVGCSTFTYFEYNRWYSWDFATKRVAPAFAKDSGMRLKFYAEPRILALPATDSRLYYRVLSPTQYFDINGNEVSIEEGKLSAIKYRWQDFLKSYSDDSLPKPITSLFIPRENISPQLRSIIL